MFFWYIPLIFLPITYNFFLRVFLNLLKRFKNGAAKVTITISGIGIIILFQARDHFYLRKNILKSKYNKLQILILRLDLYHCFFVLLIIWISCFNLLQYKNTEQQYLVIIVSYLVRALNRRLIWGSSWLLLVRFVYICKLTGSLVT